MAAVVNTPEKCPEASSDVAMSEEVTPEKCVEAGKKSEEVTPEKCVEAGKEVQDAKNATRIVKRPTNPFFLFMADKKKELMAAHGIKNSDVPKKAKEFFDALSAEERKVYEEKYQEQKKTYEAWAATEEGQQLVRELKEQKAKERKEAKDADPVSSKKAAKKTPVIKLKKCRAFMKRALADKKCPVQKPQNSLWQFIQEKRASIMKEYGLKGVEQVGSKAKELFHALAPEERKVYEDRFLEQKRIFEEFKKSPEGIKYFSEVKEVVTSVSKEVEKKEEERAKMLKRKEAVKKANEKANPVKRPSTPFQQFLEEKQASIIAEHKVKRPQRASIVQKIAQELFDALPAQERSFYETRYEKQMKAFEQFKEIEKKALLDYKASLRMAKQVPKEPKPPRKRAAATATKAMPKAPKKAKANAEEEATVSPDIAAKAASMGLADSGVSYVRLLEKLLTTPGFRGKVNEENALAVLKKNGGNVNLSRNELKPEA